MNRKTTILLTILLLAGVFIAGCTAPGAGVGGEQIQSEEEVSAATENITQGISDAASAIGDIEESIG